MGNILASIDDLVRSKVRRQGHTLVQVCGGEDIHFDAGPLESVF